MATRTIEVSDTTYNRLMDQADRLHTTPEQLLDRLLTDDVVVLLDDGATDLPDEEPTEEESMAALHRLTTLFADFQDPNLDEILNDPRIALAQASLIINNELHS